MRKKTDSLIKTKELIADKLTIAVENIDCEDEKAIASLEKAAAILEKLQKVGVPQVENSQINNLFEVLLKSGKETKE